MSRIAFLSPEGAYAGAGEAGLKDVTVEGPGDLEAQVMGLAGEGHSLIVVTEDLLGGGEERIERALAAAHPGVSLLVVPGAAGGTGEHQAYMRRRLAAALGIDVWGATAARAEREG